jgi:hypothetical protein
MLKHPYKKLVLSIAVSGTMFGMGMGLSASAADYTDVHVDQSNLSMVNGLSDRLGYNDGEVTNPFLAISLSNSDEKVSEEEESVMPASFYSELQQGKVQGAEVQIGSDLSELKAKAGEPEAEYDFEGGIRHVYGNYAYGIPYMGMEPDGKPVTTVTYHFKEKPTVEEVRRYMGSAEVEEGMDFDYLWYSKDDHEVFFEFPAGANKIDNVTVKWNY